MTNRFRERSVFFLALFVEMFHATARRIRSRPSGGDVDYLELFV